MRAKLKILNLSKEFCKNTSKLPLNLEDTSSMTDGMAFPEAIGAKRPILQIGRTDKDIYRSPFVPKNS